MEHKLSVHNVPGQAGCSTDDATPRSNWSAVPVGVTGGPVQQIMY